jgi:hypothetical protein
MISVRFAKFSKWNFFLLQSFLINYYWPSEGSWGGGGVFLSEQIFMIGKNIYKDLFIYLINFYFLHLDFNANKFSEKLKFQSSNYFFPDICH